MTQALEEIPEFAIRVLDHGYVHLLASNASDLDVVNAARASFNSRQSKMDQRGEGLVNFLMRERHGTPFEHNFFKFEIRAPIVVNREWFRHRIGSFNEESGRYSEINPVFYSPRTRVRTQVGKPGAYKFERVSASKDDHWSSAIEEANTSAYLLYRAMLDDGVAKEVARLVLPLSTYSTFVWSVNARSIMNFLSLRNDPNAMEEIREFAKAVEIYFTREMPVTARCFNENGRCAP